MNEVLSLTAVIILLIFLAAALFLLYFYRELKRKKQEFEQDSAELEEHREFLQDAGERLLELKRALAEERKKNTELLLNMLPEQVVKDLQEKGTSQPERFAHTAVFFADIVNFTGIVPDMEPEELLIELNDIFGIFDRIFVKHNCERIKTVGDAYMAVAGLHKSSQSPELDILNAAVEAMQALKERNAQPGRRKWQMRFGVNSGPVIGGIVGSEKYMYDIFGDTVNIASRIEHLSEPMKINVPEKVYRVVQNHFDFESRGRIQIRGRGETEMYFLKGVKNQ